MSINVKADLAALQHMSPKELRVKYADVFGEASRSGNKDYLVKRIGWLRPIAATWGASIGRQRDGRRPIFSGDCARIAKYSKLRHGCPNELALTPHIEQCPARRTATRVAASRQGRSWRGCICSSAMNVCGRRCGRR